MLVRNLSTLLNKQFSKVERCPQVSSNVSSSFRKKRSKIRRMISYLVEISLYPDFILTCSNHVQSIKTNSPIKPNRTWQFTIYNYYLHMAIYNVSTDTPFLNKITIMCRKTRSENLPLYYSSLDFKLSFRIGSRSHVLNYKDVLKSL